MSCLLPQFKCLPDTFSSIHFKSHHHHNPTQLSKNGESIHFRSQCTVSTTSTSNVAVLDMEKLQLPSLETHSSSVAPNRQWPSTATTVLDLEKLHLPSLEDQSNSVVPDRPWTYIGSIGPPKEANFEATLATEMLLTSEDAVIAAAAAEAVALATAAVKFANNAAAMMVSHDGSLKLDLKPAVLLSSKVGNSLLEYPARESINVEPTIEELEVLELSKSKAVRSRRRTERKARRSKAAEKAAASVVSVKSSSVSRKKRAVEEIDYSDPLRHLRGSTGLRLLTAKEERKLSAGIQDLLKLEKLHNELTDRCGGEPTLLQWADAADVDQKTLRQRLSHGVFCKEKMIRSNIRLVISIAKNYQGVGMNLQDLVQAGCRGLVRGVEKFDASKGFKFSTYAHWWIKQAVRKSLSDQSRIIRLPFHMVEATYKVKEARKKFHSENGREPSNEELVAATGLSMTRLNAVLLAPKSTISLDDKIGDVKLSEILVDPEAETPEELLTKQFMREDLEEVINSLNEREKLVIRWRFGLDNGRMKTLQEIGDLMGVSRERVRQIESYAFRKLKNKKRTKNLQQYFVL
ncbi:hypothetical protein LguiB_011148 [Lonicera macranthoides]